MTDVQDIPASFLLRDEFDAMLAAAKVDGKCDGKTPFEYLKSIYQDDRYTTEVQRLGTISSSGAGIAAGFVGGTVAGFLVSTALGGPVGLVAACVMLILGGRSMNMIIINDTDSDISLTDRHDECGEQVMRPIDGQSGDRIPRRMAAIPDPDNPGAFLTDPMVWFGCYGFRQATTLGIGFYGTAGALSFKAQQGSVLPDGFTLGWSVPESGHNNCAVSLNLQDPDAFYKTWIDGDPCRSTDSSKNAAAGVSAYCAMESQKDKPDNANLLVVITDGKSW